MRITWMKKVKVPLNAHCKAVYKTKQSRSRHELVIHKIATVYHCKKCLYSTNRKDALQRHNKKTMQNTSRNTYMPKTL